MCVSAKFSSGSPLQKLSNTATLEKIFWEIACDLDNVSKLEIGKDKRHIVDKMNMTVLLICSSISGNGHVEFRQARRACLFSIALQEWKVQCQELSMVYLWNTWQWCHCLWYLGISSTQEHITNVCRLCYLSFQYLLLLYKDIMQCPLYLSFFIHFKQKINAGSSVTLILYDSWTFVGWGSNKKKI